MVNRKNRCDFFYFSAKKYKLRSRAAFKLIELNNKFLFLEKATGIVDLCAAPGSWMQVSRKLAPFYIPIIGIDIYPIKKLKGCQTLKGDITSPACIHTLLKVKNLFKKEINIILHDGSPKMGTKWESDVYKQNELALNAFKLAKKILTYNGWFITKIFKSQYFNNLFFVFKHFFRRIFIFKPIASRSSSTEIYLVCRGYFSNSIKYNLMIKHAFIFKEPKIQKKSGIFNKNDIHSFDRKKVLQFSIIIKNKVFFFKKNNCKIEKSEEEESLFGTNFYGTKIIEKKTNKYAYIDKNLTILNWLENNF
jgi:AdoMet-dependent rRNA methyltransferase SPB1